MNNCTIDLSNCLCERSEALDCLTDALSQCGCQVFPTWELFQETLDNNTIITNLENDGNYITVPLLTEATEAQILAVVGIGPASLAELIAALAVYNLEFSV